MKVKGLFFEFILIILSIFPFTPQISHSVSKTSKKSVPSIKVPAGNLPPIEYQRKSKIPTAAYKIVIPSGNQNSSTVKSAIKFIKKMNVAKANKIIRKYYSLLVTPITINTGLHTLISLLLYRISYLLLTGGSHRNYCSVVGSTASFGAVAYYAVHPNRIKDFLLQKFLSANISLFLLLLAVYVFLLYSKYRRLSGVNSNSGSAVDKSRFSVPNLRLLVIGSCLSVGATAVVAHFTQSLPLTAGSVSLVLIAASLTVSYGNENLGESGNETETTALSWRNLRLLLLLMSSCVLYISWVNLVDNVAEARVCKLRPTLGMLIAETIVFATKLCFECVKPLWIIRRRSAVLLPVRVSSLVFEYASIAVSGYSHLIHRVLFGVLSQSIDDSFGPLNILRGVMLSFVFLVCGLLVVRFIFFLWNSIFRPGHSHYRLHLYVYVVLLYVIFSVPSALSNGKASKDIQSLVYSRLVPAKTSTPTLIPTPIRSKTIGAGPVNTISLASTIRDALFAPLTANNKGLVATTTTDSRYVCGERIVRAKNGTRLYGGGSSSSSSSDVFRLVNWKQLTAHDDKLSDYFTSCVPAAFLTVLIAFILADAYSSDMAPKGVERNVAVSVFRYESNRTKGSAVGVAVPIENKKVTFRDVSQDSNDHISGSDSSVSTAGSGGNGEAKIGAQVDKRRSKDNGTSSSGGGIVRRQSDSNGVVTRQYSELVSSPPAAVSQTTQWILRCYGILIIVLVLQSYCLAYFDSLPNKVKLNNTKS